MSRIARSRRTIKFVKCPPRFLRGAYIEYPSTATKRANVEMGNSNHYVENHRNKQEIYVYQLASGIGSVKLLDKLTDRENKLMMESLSDDAEQYR